MHFRYTPVPDWPPLAWLACGHRGDPTVEVFHGLDVETTPDGFSEAVWDGEFARAGFDETDLVFGSGARRRGGGVTFVSSGSTVDRLHSHEVAGRVCVANSLACLLVAIGADVDPTYAGYYADFKSISDGLVRYARARDSTRPTSCSAPERAAAAGASRSFRPARPWTGCTRTRWLGGCAWRTRSPACSSPSAPTWTRPTPGITRTSNRSATAWYATP